MLKSLALILTLFLLSGPASSIESSELVTRIGTTYRINSSTPYTGIETNFYDNGQKANEAHYVDGKLEGLMIHWFANGAKSSELTYVNGELGKEKFWYPNGVVKSETGVIDSKGRELLRISFYPDGEPESALIPLSVDGRKGQGHMEFWPDRTNKSKTTYVLIDAGTNSYVEHGLKTTWSEDGQVTSEINYVDGEVQGVSKFYQDGRLTMASCEIDGMLYPTWKLGEPCGAETGTLTAEPEDKPKKRSLLKRFTDKVSKELSDQ